MGLRTQLGSLCLWAALSLCACGFDETPTAAACVPGMSSQCPCSGGVIGGQTCGKDGAFGACDCSLPAGVSGSSSSGRPDAGTSSSGTSGGEAGMSGGSAGNGAAGTGASGSGGGIAGTQGGAGTGMGGAGGVSGIGGTGQGGSMATACTPEELSCAMRGGAQWVTRCNAEGTELEPDHACAGYETCRDGACHCIAKRVFCAENELRECDAAGQDSKVVQTCTDGQICNAPMRTCQGICTPDDCSCEGSAQPCCTAAGLCGCAGFLGLACTPQSNGDAKQCTCG